MAERTKSILTVRSFIFHYKSFIKRSSNVSDMIYNVSKHLEGQLCLSNNIHCTQVNRL